MLLLSVYSGKMCYCLSRYIKYIIYRSVQVCPILHICINEILLKCKSVYLFGGADGGTENRHQFDYLLVLRHTLVVVSDLEWDGLNHRCWNVWGAAVWKEFGGQNLCFDRMYREWVDRMHLNLKKQLGSLGIFHL